MTDEKPEMKPEPFYDTAAIDIDVPRELEGYERAKYLAEESLRLLREEQEQE